MKKSIAFFAYLILPSLVLTVYGQHSENTELYKVLMEKDSLLFHAAFNTCDPETMTSLFTEDFEFYHDKGGATLGRDEFLAPMVENCGQQDKNALQPSKRILIEKSLRVYPLRKDGVLYGAIQEGVHRFEFLNDQKQYQKGDIAKFTHLWIITDGEWKIKRELSYDHQPALSYQIE